MITLYIKNTEDGVRLIVASETVTTARLSCADYILRATIAYCSKPPVVTEHEFDGRTEYFLDSHPDLLTQGLAHKNMCRQNMRVTAAGAMRTWARLNPEYETNIRYDWQDPR